MNKIKRKTVDYADISTNDSADYYGATKKGQLQDQDLLIKQKQDLLYLISRVQVKLNKLDEVDMQLIEQRYKYKKTLRELAQNMYNGKSTMSRRLDDILLKLI